MKPADLGHKCARLSVVDRLEQGPAVRAVRTQLRDPMADNPGVLAMSQVWGFMSRPGNRKSSDLSPACLIHAARASRVAAVISNWTGEGQTL